MTKGLLLAALMVSWSGARAQVPEEKRPEFVATGAVVTFDEICLKIYTDYDKANAWMRDHSNQEDATKRADPYREDPSDHVFFVGSPVASYVVTFAEDNLCTVYSTPVDKKTTELLLRQLMDGYAAQWKATFEETRNELVREREQVVAYMANIPGTDKPILGIQVSYIAVKDEKHPLLRISGVSLKRLQTHPRPGASQNP